jgi:hypothetical protein
VNGAYADAVATLGLDEWINQLDADNQAFDALLQTRYTENAGKQKVRMSEIRMETDRCYRDMLDRIEASMLLNGETPYAPFVSALNIYAEHYANVIAQRKGRKKTDAKPAESES